MSMPILPLSREEGMKGLEPAKELGKALRIFSEFVKSISEGGAASHVVTSQSSGMFRSVHDSLVHFQKDVPISLVDLKELLEAYKVAETSRKKFAEMQKILAGYVADINVFQEDLLLLINAICMNEQKIDPAAEKLRPLLVSIQKAQQKRIAVFSEFSAITKSLEELRNQVEATKVELDRFSTDPDMDILALLQDPGSKDAADCFQILFPRFQAEYVAFEHFYRETVDRLRSLRSASSLEDTFDTVLEFRKKLDEDIEMHQEEVSASLLQTILPFLEIKGIKTHTPQKWIHPLSSAITVKAQFKDTYVQVKVKTVIGEGTENKIRRMEIYAQSDYKAYVQRKPKEKTEILAMEKEFDIAQKILEKNPKANIIRYELETHKDGSPKALRMKEYSGSIASTDIPGDIPRSYIALRMAQSVQATHAAGFIHRDLKIDNFLIDLSENPPEIVLTDFGLSCKRGDKRGVCGSLNTLPPEMFGGSEATRAQGTPGDLSASSIPYSRGTPPSPAPSGAVSPPPMAKSKEEVDPRAEYSYDIWGLGCALFSVLYPEIENNPLMKAQEKFLDDEEAGKFADKSSLDYWHTYSDSAMKQVKDMLRQSSGPLEKIILRCLEYDPSSRPTIDEVVAELEKI